jgi:hypothetical protein
LKIGDILPDDGSIVYYIAKSARGHNIRSRRLDGTIRRIRYSPQTILPGPDERHPSRFEGGHPWNRKG